MRIPSIGGAVLAALSLAAAHPVAAKDTPTNPYPGYHSAVYADPSHWLCRGDTDDVCDHDLDAAIVKASGKTSTEHWKPGRHPKFDCFYVYPTISSDPLGNSDLVPDPDAELFVVRQQAARLGTVCRVFAPVYRQVTLTALIALLGGQNVAVDRELPYADVVDAWKHYIANDSQGRGVVLIGHSQGAGILTSLIQNEIDPSPVLRDRLVSAMLLGTSLQVPDGQDVGGDFANIPLCHSPHDTGCAISYGSFRASKPPPANSFFGTSSRPGWKAACTNPASLRGGNGFLHPFLPTDGASLPIITVPPPTWVDPAKRPITTPFVTLPRFVEAKCAETNGFVYLALTPKGDPADPRIDDIGGDLTPEWGMHLIDVNVAMGDLVAIAGSQGKAWRMHH
jgi:Protein of unknown function (DUF3089)